MALATDALTAHFTYGELRAHTAPAQVLPNLRSTAAYLEVLRSILGVPLKVTSGYRSPAYNAGIPGASPTSDHVNGLAADFVPLGMAQYDAYKRIKAAQASGALPVFDQIIYYPFQHIHVGLGARQRRQVLLRVAERRYATLTPDLAATLPGSGTSTSVLAILAIAFVAAAVLFGTFHGTR